MPLTENTKKLAKLVQTSKYTHDRMTLMGELDFRPDNDDRTYQRINIYEDLEYQSIEGFGGAFTEAAAITFYKLGCERQKEIINAYFHPEKGLGYSICRTHINSCDFSEGNYAYVEDKNDIELKTFSAKRDKKALIPLIKEAKKVQGRKSSCWMKTAGRIMSAISATPRLSEIRRMIRLSMKAPIIISDISVNL